MKLHVFRLISQVEGSIHQEGVRTGMHRFGVRRPLNPMEKQQ